MQSKDILPLRRIDHVRFFVGNARQSAYFYRNAFGFDVVAYAGLETRLRLSMNKSNFSRTLILIPDRPNIKTAVALSSVGGLQIAN